MVVINSVTVAFEIKNEMLYVNCSYYDPKKEKIVGERNHLYQLKKISGDDMDDEFYQFIGSISAEFISTSISALSPDGANNASFLHVMLFCEVFDYIITSIYETGSTDCIKNTNYLSIDNENISYKDELFDECDCIRDGMVEPMMDKITKR